jgi:hypothetical protein
VADFDRVPPARSWRRRFLLLFMVIAALLALSGAVSGAVALYLPQHPADPAPPVRFQVGG